MKILHVFGIGADKILAKGCCTRAVVTGVGRSYLYVIKKPVRLYVNESNTLYSHYIFFRYAVNGIPYTGKLFVTPHYRYPEKGESFDLYYDPEHPEKYACYAFPMASRPIGW